MQGRVRWATFALFAMGGAAIGATAAWGMDLATPARLAVIGGGGLVAMGILSVDLAGTTPWYGSYINTWHNVARIELVPERCTAAADCVQVCPCDILQMQKGARQVAVARGDQCIQCGVCIVQCPKDALRFRYDDGRVVEADTIRHTRMNLVGRRTVAVRR